MTSEMDESLQMINVEAEVSAVDKESITTDTSTLSRSTISHRYVIHLRYQFIYIIHSLTHELVLLFIEQ